MLSIKVAIHFRQALLTQTTQIRQQKYLLIMLTKIYYKIFEILILGIMLAFFGLYVIYLLIEMIIFSFVDVFRAIYRK